MRENEVTLVDSAGLGRLIREARKAQGLTQGQLAGVSGVGLRFVHELESGKPTCELQKALNVARMLGIRLVAMPPDV